MGDDSGLTDDEWRRLVALFAEFKHGFLVCEDVRLVEAYASSRCLSNEDTDLVSRYLMWRYFIPSAK